MIKSIRLQNFFGFQDCTINLEKGENVLVGINGSGKSNFFKALKLLNAVEHPNTFRHLFLSEFGGYDSVSNFQRGDYDDIIIESVITADIIGVSTKTSEIHYKLQFSKVPGSSGYLLNELLVLKEGKKTKELLSFNSGNGRILKNGLKSAKPIYEKHLNFVDRVPALTKFHSDENGTVFEKLQFYFSQIECFEQIPTNSYSSLRKTRPISGANRLQGDGGNLAAVLQTLKANNINAFNKIREALRKVNEHFIDFDFVPVGNGSVELQLRENKFIRNTPLHLISDGTLRFLCLVAIFYNPNRGSIICFDEPETGLHPDMVNTLYRAIEYAAETSQIIISTHSAHLLDYFRLTNIRVFEKDENNATEVMQYTNDDFEGWYKQFNPGEMWRAGDIGGNRW